MFIGHEFPPQLQRLTMDSLGFIYHQLGQTDRAITCYRDAIALNRDTGDRYFEAIALSRLGDVYQTAGDYERADAAWQRSFEQLDELDHPDAVQVHAKLARSAD